MRGDGVGVGDIGEVPSFTWGARHQTGDDDGGDAGRERDARVVGGHRRAERDAAAEPGGDGVELGDGARGEHGAGGVHVPGSRSSYGMRVDGVGVGDIRAVPGSARNHGITQGRHDIVVDRAYFKSCVVV